MSKTFTDWLIEQAETIDESTKVTINSPGHKLHGKVATVFHKHEDGRINVQVQHSQKKGDVSNITLKPGQFNESEQVDESYASTFKSETDSMKPGTRKWVGRAQGKEVHAHKSSSGKVTFYHKDGIRGQAVKVQESEQIDEETRVEISKKEFDTLAAKHATAQKNNRTGKYANAAYFYDDKEKDNGLNRGAVKQIYSHAVHGIPTIEDGGGKHYKFVKESVELDEGKWTVNSKTGAKLDPRTGAAIPGTSKAEKTLQKVQQRELAKAQRPVASKPDLDKIWRKVEEIVGRIYPDGDPIDWLGPWMKQQGWDYSFVEKAAKKHGYKDVYDYWDSMGDDLGYNESEEIHEAIKQSDFLAYADASNKGFRPTIAHKADPNRIMYSAGVHYKTKDAAKSHAEEYLKGYADKGANEADRRAWKFRSANTHNIAGMNESEELDEVVSPFDWKKYTAQSNKPEGNSGVHKGTYGSEDHKAKGSGEPEEKRGRGRPKGEYGSYKIDKAKRDDPEYKKQLSAKVMAAKAENFKIRKEFKDSMNDAIKKHQLKLAGLDK